MTEREHSTTKVTPECSGHGVRCALNCRERWPEDEQPEHWKGVTMVGPGGGAHFARDVAQQQSADERAGGDRAAHVAGGVVPQGQQADDVPAEIGQLTCGGVGPRRQSADERAGGDRAAHVAEGVLELGHNQLTSVPAEIGQLTSLETLHLNDNQLASLPAEIGQLTSLRKLWLTDNWLTSVPAAIYELRAAGCEVILPFDSGGTRFLY